MRGESQATQNTTCIIHALARFQLKMKHPNFMPAYLKPPSGKLKEKAAIAEEMLNNWKLCPRECKFETAGKRGVSSSRYGLEIVLAVLEKPLQLTAKTV